MKSEGTVLRLDGDYAIVGVKRMSACDTCRAKCGGHCDKASTVETKVKNELSAKVGDSVVLFTDTNKVLYYALIVFIMPLVAALIGYLTARITLKSAALSGISAIIFFILAFFVIWLVWGRKDRNENITMIEIKGVQNDRS